MTGEIRPKSLVALLICGFEFQVSFQESKGRARRLGPGLKLFVERPTKDDEVCNFGVADLTSLMDVLASEADIGSGGNNLVPDRNEVRPYSRLSYFAPLLRRIIFIGEPPLGCRLDLQRVGLSSVGSSAAISVGATSPIGSDVANGEIITQRDEMLSLTDMHKAAKASRSQEPARWRELPETVVFVDCLSVTTGKSGSLFQVKEGRGGGTWAHWQIGLAQVIARSADTARTIGGHGYFAPRGAEFMASSIGAPSSTRAGLQPGDYRHGPTAE